MPDDENSGSARPTHKPRILVVDDLLDNVRILVSALSGRYAVLPATDGEAALRIARSGESPDLVLLDVSMPGMDGFAVCEALKNDERTKAIPVIFITSADDIERKTRGFALGAVDYITKPFEILEVEARVRTHVALVEARRRLEAQNRELVEAAALKEDVERITRHDLKGPLNVIIALPQMMLEDEALDAEERESLELILESGQKMLRMINLSLDIFKMERKLYVLAPGQLDIVKVLGDVRREFASLAKSGSIGINILVDGRLARAGDSRTVVGEELLYYCLFSNLVKNAVEASPDGSEVEIAIGGGGGGETSIIVTNSGEVPLEIRESFFEKYTTSGKSGGTGLGTYSAKLIAETMGAMIRLDSSKAGRTSLIVGIPH